MSSSQFIATEFTFLPVGNHTRTGVDTAQVITSPTRGSIIFMQAEGGDIRYTVDGSTPSATNGFVLRTTDGVLRLDLFQNRTVRVIGTSAGYFVNYLWARRV